ncbi:MAG: Arc family DNA-binding protein [Calditrichaeota bacterium]|nr:MAG: Arc family DNA-binding protein [Calditrichota bacterium]
MAAITVKNIPDDLYLKLKDSASKNHRSINSEVIACLDKVLTSKLIDPDEYLVGVRQIREKIDAPVLTDEFLNSAKKEGRP